MATVWILARPLWILDHSRLISLLWFTAETCTKHIYYLSRASGMEFVFNTNWSRWIGTADWTGVGRIKKLLQVSPWCWSVHPTLRTAWALPTRVSCLSSPARPVSQSWGCGVKPQSRGGCSQSCAALGLVSQGAFVTGRGTLRSSVAVVVQAAALGSPPFSWCLGDQTTRVCKLGVTLESIVLQWARVCGKNVNHVSVFGINIYIWTVLIGNHCSF